MKDFNENQQEEIMYLEKTLTVIKKALQKGMSSLNGKLTSVISSRKEMWEGSVHFSEDFDRIPEMNHFLSEVTRETRDYTSVEKKIQRYSKMLKSPYFGRFDFIEAGYEDVEKIYIGIGNLMDEATDEIFVYDWRAPISSIFYRCELSQGYYDSPVGKIEGEVLLKRQYKIQDSKLKYFFDSSIRINDEILQEVLSSNSSSKMKSIVETIQKEQDIIIRDVENELLIVQGVAGSGKTSIALHRIAFLLYYGLSSKLGVNNIIIVSPNSIFSKYISEVLPELGEENVEQITFDNIISQILAKKFLIETRQGQLENLIISNEDKKNLIKMESIKFKGSIIFIKILNNLIEYYERCLIDFKDIYYDGEVIETRQEMRNFFLINKINIPPAKRLKRIENMILNKIHPLRKKRLRKIENIVEKSGNHMLEIKAFSRLLAIKEAKIFMEYIHSFTQTDYIKIYKFLFCKKGLFSNLAQGLQLPKDIDEIISETNKELSEDHISYEDSIALLYLKLKLEGNEDFSEIKQVVIDEAQDYYPLQYEIFKLLFKDARYTVLGDFNQTLEKCGDRMIYDDVPQILNKRKAVKMFLNKSYRSSYEINSFIQRLSNEKNQLIPFERHEDDPKVFYMKNKDLLDKKISQDINKYFEQGYESIAVICKTMKEAEEVEGRLGSLVNVKLLNDEDSKVKNCALVMPSYLAKGLEFDAVLIYDCSAENYKNEFDKRLIYIACTRALHKLNIYYTGNRSPLI